MDIFKHCVIQYIKNSRPFDLAKLIFITDECILIFLLHVCSLMLFLTFHLFIISITPCRTMMVCRGLTMWTTSPCFALFIKKKPELSPQHFLSFKWASSNRSLIWKLPSFSYTAKPLWAQWKAKVYCGFYFSSYFPNLVWLNWVDSDRVYAL